MPRKSDEIRSRQVFLFGAIVTVRCRGSLNDLGDRAEKTSVMINIEDEYVAELSLLYQENSK